MSLALGIGRYVVLDDSASEKTTSQKNSGVQASEGAQMFFRARKQQGIVTGLEPLQQVAHPREAGGDEDRDCSSARTQQHSRVCGGPAG